VDLIVVSIKMLEFHESSYIDIDPSTTKLIVYSEIECRIEIKRITNVRETKQILMPGISVGCFCQVKFDPSAPHTLHMKFSGYDLAIKEVIFERSLLEINMLKRFEHQCRVFYISKASDVLNRDLKLSMVPLSATHAVGTEGTKNILEGISAQQFSLLYELAAEPRTFFIDKICSCIHTGLNCHLRNNYVYENFMLHSSLETPCREEIWRRQSFFRHKPKHTIDWNDLFRTEY
jgi:hypothetical protein